MLGSIGSVKGAEGSSDTLINRLFMAGKISPRVTTRRKDT